MFQKPFNNRSVEDATITFSIDYIETACIFLIFLIATVQRKGICFSRPSALGPICRPSALGPSAPRPLKFSSAVFDFLPVCVVKCSCTTILSSLFTNIRIVVKRPTDSTVSTTSRQTNTTSDQTSTANGQMGTTSGQTNTTSRQTSTING